MQLEGDNAHDSAGADFGHGDLASHYITRLHVHSVYKHDRYTTLLPLSRTKELPERKDKWPKKASPQIVLHESQE